MAASEESHYLLLHRSRIHSWSFPTLTGRGRPDCLSNEKFTLRVTVIDHVRSNDFRASEKTKVQRAVLRAKFLGLY